MKVNDPNLSDFILPLTDEAIQILKDQRETSKSKKWVFVSSQFYHTRISDNTFNKTLKGLWFDVRLHGFRAMYRSLANTYLQEHKTSLEARESN